MLLPHCFAVVRLYQNKLLLSTDQTVEVLVGVCVQDRLCSTTAEPGGGEEGRGGEEEGREREGGGGRKDEELEWEVVVAALSLTTYRST